MSTTHSLVIDDVDLRLDQHILYRGLSLRIKRHAICALMGPSGSGKSTLLNLVAGNLDGDNVHWEGRIDLYPDEGGESARVVLMRQRPQILLRPAQQWLRQCHPRRGELTALEMRQFLQAYLEELGLADIAGRLSELPVDWPVGRRRLLLIAGYLLASPDLLCLDEPFAGLDDDEADRLVDFLDAQRGRQTVLWCTHHQKRARRLADEVHLMAGGRIVESAPSEQFFDCPQTEPAKTFVRSGSCVVPSPNTPPEHLAPEYRALATPTSSNRQETSSHEASSPKEVASPASSVSLGAVERLRASWRQHPDVGESEQCVYRRTPYEPAHRGPSEFHWIWPGMLAGVAKPGLLRPLERDLRALERVEIDALVTLTEAPLKAEVVEARGIQYLHTPIVDMEAPTLEDAMRTCRWVDHRLQNGGRVAYHCRAGIGRTGTLLAAQIIATTGLGADEAIALIRRVFARYVQSETQRRFLARFARMMDSETPPLQCPTPGTSPAA